MAATTSYRVAATNENWAPLSGVQIEATNLTTLKPDDVQRTGLDGVAEFTGLPAGPHFFRVRARRVSTAVGGRTYTGLIRLQVVAMGNQGIVKHYVVDANGMGTHTTVQAAVTAALAASETRIVIYINPGLYTENITCDFAGDAAGKYIYFVAEGAVAGWEDGEYNNVVEIKRSNTDNPTFSFEGNGKVQMLGLRITGSTGGGIEVGKEVGDTVYFEMDNCYVTVVSGGVFITRLNTAIDGRVSNSLLHHTSGRAIVLSSGSGFIGWAFTGVRFLGAGGLWKGMYSGLSFGGCRATDDPPDGEAWLEDQALGASGGVAITNCSFTFSDFATLGGVVWHGGTARSGRIVVHGCALVASRKCKLVQIEAVDGAIINDNYFEGQGSSDGSVGVNIIEGASGERNKNAICLGNSFRDLQDGIVAETASLAADCVIGPNAFYNVANTTTNIPADIDYQISLDTVSCALLDGTIHTDTVAQAVTAGSLIFGNDTPAWDELAISIPAANVRNVLGIDNGETTPSWKTALDGTNPADIAGSASPGTSLIFAHRDHVHTHPSGLGASLHHTAFTASDHTTIGDSAPHHAKYTDLEAIAAVEGEATLALDGAITEIHGDANFTLSIVSSNPRITFDSGDYLEYNRAANRFDLNRDLDVAGHLAVGTNATISATQAAKIWGIFTNTSGTLLGCSFLVALTPSSATSADAYGVAGAVSATAAYAYTGVLAGFQADVRTNIKPPTGVTYNTVYGNRIIVGMATSNADGTISNVQGVRVESGLVSGATGTIINLKGVSVVAPSVASGAITNAWGMDIGNMGAAGTSYGLQILDQTGAGTHYGLAIAGADTQALWVCSGSQATDAANGIAFGSGRDTNLYRSAANVLKTDDSLEVAGDLFFTTDGSGLPYGHMYGYNISETVGVAATETFYELTTGLTGGELNLVTLGTAHELTVTKAGRYLITWSMSVRTGTANDEVEATITVNNTASTTAAAHTTLPKANASTTLAGSTVLDLAAGDDISMAVLNHTAIRDIVVEHVACTVVMVGGT